MAPGPRLSVLLIATAAYTAAAARPRAGSHHHAARSLGGRHSHADMVSRRAEFVAARAAAPRTATVACDGAPCTFEHSSTGYWEACGGAAGNLGTFHDQTPAAAQLACCTNSSCAGFSFACSDSACATGSGYYKANADCGFIASGVQGYVQPGKLPVLPSVQVALAPAPPLTARLVENVTVTFKFLTGAPNRTSDWIGQVCAGAPIEDYLEWAPIDQAEGWATGTGSLVFPVFRSRCDYTFVVFRGVQPLWPSGGALGTSVPLTWAGPSWATAPFHGHVAYGGEDTQHSMTVSFTTNSTPGSVVVMLGTASGVYALPNATDVESTTYGAGDLCNAPANTTSVDFWQWPGVFHHVIVRGLSPSTRYYALPVADGVAGEELTFVTGKALGPDVPLTFALYGDMSVTSYVLDGDTHKDTVDGGPGAVGTAQLLRARLDAGEPLDFVAHVGDLGYAKGEEERPARGGGGGGGGVAIKAQWQ